MVGAIAFIALPWIEEGRPKKLGLQNVEEAVYSDREKGLFRCLKILGVTHN